MKYTQVDKTKLVNLEYTLFREILRTNRAGAYSSTTIIGCNTRKYHGLLVCPIDDESDERYVMLSSLQCSVIQRDKSFNLGIQQYQDNHFEPKGHKYIWDFETNPTPKLTYRVGGVLISQELMLAANEHQVLLRYTLLEAHSATKLRLKPFLAFRNIHELTCQNLLADTHYTEINNGISIKLYPALPPLYLQCNKKSEFIPIPDWYRDVEYMKEQHRGYHFREDLYVPGYFEIDIEKGESIVFAVGLKETSTSGLKAKFTREVNARVPRCTMLNNLVNAAQQFVVNKNNHATLIAGYHWYKEQLRDTLVALPGLTLYQEDKKPFLHILETSVEAIRKKYLDKDSKSLLLEDVDVPLWLFYTLKECQKVCGKTNYLTKYYPLLKEILEFYKRGVPNQLQLLENGLIDARRENHPLTWMNAMVDNKPVTPRYGSPVEVNALWYNAIATLLDTAKQLKDEDCLATWKPILAKLDNSFPQSYWYDAKGYLYDNLDGTTSDKALRPNQIIAVALPYSPLTKEQKKSILDTVMSELLTPKGLRSLSPQHAKYQGVIEGNEEMRSKALHQGAVYPWLIAFVADAQMAINNRSAISVLKRIIEEFESEMTEHCLGTISECYNGNSPHQGKGAVSMAWNVAAVLRIIHITETNA
ncbi:MAG: glycogen debranching enzyme family protein [Breznakibacter sp.]|nr:glycogen debranching enzyme family protein [Breznakibacter sp.]